MCVKQAATFANLLITPACPNRAVFAGSVVGLKGNSGQCAYSASKAGLEGLTRSLAKEVASRNIRVNLLAPGTMQPHTLCMSLHLWSSVFGQPFSLSSLGFIHTDMTAGLREEAGARSIPLGRFGTPEEVAQAVLFLLHSSYITGQVLVVDGGLQLAM